MDWVVSVLVAGAVLAAIWKLLGWQVMGRGRRREDLERSIRALLVLREDGSRLHVRHRGSALAFDFIRAGGRDDEALLVLRLPRASWSKGHEGKLANLFESQLFSVRLVEDPQTEALVEVRIPVEDIWEEWCGARGARAAHLLLDAFAVPSEARFDLTLYGLGSWRGPRREWDRLRERHR